MAIPFTAFFPSAFTPGDKLPQIAQVIPKGRGAQVLFISKVLLELGLSYIDTEGFSPKLLRTILVPVVVLSLSSTVLANTTYDKSKATESNPVSGTTKGSSVATRAGSGVSILSTCDGCLAQTGLIWTDYGIYERVGVDYIRNVADELIDSQHVHGALLADDDGQCAGYEGDYMWTGSQDQNSAAYSLSISSNGTKYTAANDAWQLASGHDWWNDGGHWEVKGEADICQEF